MASQLWREGGGARRFLQGLGARGAAHALGAALGLSGHWGRCAAVPVDRASLSAVRSCPGTCLGSTGLLPGAERHSCWGSQVRATSAWWWPGGGGAAPWPSSSCPWRTSGLPRHLLPKLPCDACTPVPPLPTSLLHLLASKLPWHHLDLSAHRQLSRAQSEVAAVRVHIVLACGAELSR